MSLLIPHQVPDPPASRRWVEALRWLVAVMDDEDPSLAFVSGVLSYALQNDNLITQPQSDAAQDVLNRVCRDHMAGRLDCQQRPPSVETIDTLLASTAWEPWIAGIDVDPEGADLLRAVALNMDAEGVASISQVQLALFVSLSTSEARAQLAELEERGILSIDRSSVPHSYSFASIPERAR